MTPVYQKRRVAGVMPSQPRGAGRPRDPKIDERIMNAAVKLLLRDGPNGMTMDAVAKEAQVGKATVYRRWKTKDALMEAATKHLHRNKIVAPNTGVLRDDLVKLMSDVLEFVNSQEGANYFKLLIGESTCNKAIAVLYRDAFSHLKQQLQECFERGWQRGEVASNANVSLAVELLVGVVFQYVALDDAPASEYDVNLLVDFVLRGLN